MKLGEWNVVVVDDECCFTCLYNLISALENLLVNVISIYALDRILQKEGGGSSNFPGLS